MAQSRVNTPRRLTDLKASVTSLLPLILRRKVSKEALEAIRPLGVQVKYRLHYKILDVVAEGQISNVYLVKRKLGDPEKLAAKVSTASTSKSVTTNNLCESADVRTLARELRILRKVQNKKHVVHLEEYFYLVQAGEERMWMVMEYLPITLYDLLDLDRIITVEEAGVVACGLIDALEFIHSCGVMHMDLKLENVLLSKDGSVKLCDFGVAEEFVKGEKKICTGPVGTPYTMAIELWLEGRPYDESVDIWSLGVIIYLLTRREPEKTYFLGEGLDGMKHSYAGFFGTYKKSNDFYFMKTLEPAVIDWEKKPAEEWEEFKERYCNGEKDSNLVYSRSIAYRDVFAFCRKTIVPMPQVGLQTRPITRKDVLDRATLQQLKELELVRDSYDNEDRQRRVVASLVEEIHEEIYAEYP